jgi:YesN/AraC family two-component response regulator
MSKRPLEIVIVDDEKQITELIKMAVLFASQNTSIHTFTDPEKARDYLEKNQVDILITDYKMPKYNGLQLMEGVSPLVKKVLISGYVSEIAEEKLTQLNATFFEKPVPMKALGKIIAEQEKLVSAK